MSEVSTLVQPKETTPRWDTPDSYQTLLKREHAAAYRAAELLYGTIDDRDFKDKLNLLHHCRTNAWFIRHQTSGEVRIASNSCKLRWCPLCQAARQNYIASEVSRWFCCVELPKLLTLTLRHTTAPLKSQVDFLYKSFQKFRKRKFVSSRLRGGVWFFQVKKSKDNLTWHPHLHILIDSDFMDHKELSKLWAKITLGSTVVDIRSVRNTEYTVKHHARYCASPCDLVDLLLHEKIALFDTFAKRRLVGCFGTARSVSLRPNKPPDSDSWISVGAWYLIVGLAGEDYRADEILEAWRNKKPLAPDITMIPVECEIEGRAPPEEKPLTGQQNYLDFYAGF